MLSVVFLLASAAAGIAAIHLLTWKGLWAADTVFAGVVLGWCFATIAAYCGAWLAGALTSQVILRVTICLVFVALALWWCARKKKAAGVASYSYGGWCGVPLLLFLPVYVALFHTRMFCERPDGIYSGGTSFYDLPFHSAITTSFLYARNFPPIYTLLPPEPLLYPCLPDFLTAVVVAGGLNLHLALCLTGITLATAITGLLYCFASEIIVSAHNQRAAAVATILVLLNGGLAFSIRQLTNQQVRWGNVIVDSFLPQRASLFGYAIGLIVLTIFASHWKRSPNESSTAGAAGWKQLLAAGILTGSLPFFQPHSYLAVIIVGGFLFLLRPRAGWLAFATPAVSLPLPLLLGLAWHIRGLGHIRLDPNWLGHGSANWLVAWLFNAGVAGVLVVPVWFASPRPWRRFYIAFAGLAGLALLVVFSPNEVDNFKLLFYCYAAISVLIAQWLVRLSGGPSWRKVAAALLAAGCIIPGICALCFEIADDRLMFSRADEEAARFVREHTAADALFLTAPSFHQPVVSLAGRSVVRANTSWLWSHGYNFRAREADVKRIYAGTSDAAELLRYYAVDYLYLGETERRQFRPNETFLDGRFPLIYEHAAVKIYDTRGDDRKAGGRDHRPAPREYASRLDKDPDVFFTAFCEVGYFLYRNYLDSLGRQPRYEEFIRDLNVLGRGLYVSSPGWERVLEDNKHRLRPEMGAAVPDAVTNRDDYDAAWVLVHYFAYLRRNPDDPPDNAMNGYEYWLANLKRTHDYAGLSRAFLESMEYQDRPVDASSSR